MFLNKTFLQTLTNLKFQINLTSNLLNFVTKVLDIINGNIDALDIIK